MRALTPNQRVLLRHAVISGEKGTLVSGPSAWLTANSLVRRGLVRVKASKYGSRIIATAAGIELLKRLP